MLRLAKATVSRPHQHLSNNRPEGSRGCNTAGTQTLAMLQWVQACGEEAHNLWIMVQLLGASRKMQQQVGVIKMNPAKLLAGGTLHLTLVKLAPSQWRAGVGRERALSQPLATPAGTRKMMVAEECGTALAPREAAHPSTLEVGVRLMEEREATSRVEEGTAG